MAVEANIQQVRINHVGIARDVCKFAQLLYICIRTMRVFKMHSSAKANPQVVDTAAVPDKTAGYSQLKINQFSHHQHQLGKEREREKLAFQFVSREMRWSRYIPCFCFDFYSSFSRFLFISAAKGTDSISNDFQVCGSSGGIEGENKDTGNILESHQFHSSRETTRAAKHREMNRANKSSLLAISLFYNYKTSFSFQSGSILFHSRTGESN